MKKLFLLDAYALIFRAYYALIRMPRMTQNGFNTSAIFGFVNTLEDLLKRENPTHLAVCFDPAGPTFRKKEFEEYKAQRDETPEDIRKAIPYIKDIIRAYRIPVVEVEGYEADDVIGTLACRAEKEGFTTYMMTPDKDFGQLVTDSIFQYKPSHRGQDPEIRGVKEVCDLYGLKRTSQVIDLLALMGDKIDNIPGCPGVGEKTAIKLISEYDSVEGLIENADQVKGAIGKKIKENVEQIKFSKHLATICTDVPVEFNAAELEVKAPDQEKLFAIFRELEFKSLADRVSRRLNGSQAQAKSTPADKTPSSTPSLFDDLDSSAPASDTDTDANEYPKADMSQVSYVIIEDEEGLKTLSSELKKIKRCSLFTLAEGENDMMAQYYGTAIAVAPGKVFYIPKSCHEGMELLYSFLSSMNLEKTSINIKRDMVIYVREEGKNNRPEDMIYGYYDLGLAHYVIQPEKRHDLTSLSETYLHYTPEPSPLKASQSRRFSGTLDFDEDTDTKSALWACEQADLTYRLRPILNDLVHKMGMFPLLLMVELPLVPVLADMELAGVLIDTASLRRTEADMQQRLAKIEEEIYELAGMTFNVNSPAQVGEVLFDRLLLDPKAKKTKTGQYSTGEEVLEKLVTKHPVVAKILEFRAIKKLLSTYVSALPAAINLATGRVHTNYNQTVTATGRLSSSNPNLQNIPVRDDEGREIRRAFIASPGCLFLSADYSQIELRLLADFSEDQIMIDAFARNEDIHTITASKIYHVPLEEVTPDQRRHAKTANFGIIYGISPFGLSQRLGISRADAKEIIDNYFQTFPTIQNYISKSIETARERGYVETKMHRRRYLPDINSHNHTVRSFAERNAINAPLQGTAADVIKMAMSQIYRALRQIKFKTRMIMQVHDELNFEVPLEEVDIFKQVVAKCMEAAYTGRVMLTASVGISDNWMEAH
ncbi:MAG: DNA polymerase I [Lepagella sp.]